jgi:outer membrane protein OmpA-like peptidoglycan-associated protein
VIVLVVAIVATLTGCASMSNRDRGVLVGAGAGAAVGGAIGNANDNTALGALLGAMVGGAAGGVIGNYMDEQAEEMRRDLEGATVTRVGEGIKITFDSGILFDVDSSTLRPVAQENLTDLAGILQKYEDTNILLEGHTDSDGPEQYNMDLSERRARSVANYLASMGVDMRRMSVTWYGETQPVADNDTVEGKQQNRRVEVAIMANEDLKEAAQAKAAEQG